MQLTPVLSAYWDEADAWTLAAYERHDGYTALRTALAMHPDAVIQLVKDSGLRGRGGAGFPTGMKWGFIPQGDGKPHYLVVNADESEPGTCKDIPLMLANPHSLVEGVAIASFAIRANHAFIYVRGEVVHVIRRVQQAVPTPTPPATSARTSSAPAMTSRSPSTPARARTSAVRRRPCSTPSRVVAASRGCVPRSPRSPGSTPARPSSTTSSRSPASRPSSTDGAEWFKGMGTEKSAGFTLYSLSGHVERPGQYEAPLGITLARAARPLRRSARGPRAEVLDAGRVLDPAAHRGAPGHAARLRGHGRAGSMLGTKALQIFDETTSVVRCVLRWTEFYKHESCGKCTPCREGTYWLVDVLRRLEAGEGEQGDIELLLDLCDNIMGRSFCALGDGATSPISSAIQYFRSEFEAGMHTPAWRAVPVRRLHPLRGSARLMTVTTTAPVRPARSPRTWSR